jgi:tetratricopeptide (TPR) repeat protein
MYSDQGRYDEAEPLLRWVLEVQREHLGEENPGTLATMNSLATLYDRTGRHAEAEPLYRELLEIQRRVLSADHYLTAGTMTNLGNLYIRTNRYADAARMLEMSLSTKRRVLPERHPWTRFAMNGLATAYEHLERREDAMPLARELLELDLAAADDPDASAYTLNQVAWTLLTHGYEELRDPVAALGYAERARALEEAAGGSNLWMYLDTLARAKHMTGDTAAAIETQKRAIELVPEDEREELNATLAKYEAALAAKTGAINDDQR